LTEYAGDTISRRDSVEIRTNMYEPGCTLEQFSYCLRHHGAVFGRLALEFSINFEILYWPSEGDVTPVAEEVPTRSNNRRDAKFDIRSDNWDHDIGGRLHARTSIGSGMKTSGCLRMTSDQILQRKCLRGFFFSSSTIQRSNLPLFLALINFV
jgi:hypothetical protein